MSFNKQIDINSVKILHRIGKGTFGEVFKGLWNGTEVGVKFLTPPGIINDTFLQEFTKEVMIMRYSSLFRHIRLLFLKSMSTSECFTIFGSWNKSTKYLYCYGIYAFRKSL